MSARKGLGDRAARRNNAARPPWAVLAAVGFPLVLLSIDFSGVVVALPTIGADLGAPPADLVWVVNAFALGFAAPLIAAGRIADLVGRRRVLLIGLASFSAASLVCAAAPALPVLVAGRALQGVAAGLFMTTSLSVLSAAADDGNRSSLIGMWGSIGGVASAIGPMIGGLFTELWSWRWFFGIGPLLLAPAILLTRRAVQESKDPAARRVDWLSFVAVSAGMILFVLGLQQSQTAGWTTSVWLCTGAGVVMLVAFVVLERHVNEPMLDVAIFRLRGFGSALAAGTLANWVWGATMFVLTLYLQQIVGLSPVGAGGVFLAYSITFAVVGVLAGRVSARFGTHRPQVAGLVTVAVGTEVLVWTRPAAGLLIVVVGLAITGVGQGLVYNLSASAAMGAAPADRAGVASGVVNTARNLGLAVGVSVTTTLIAAASRQVDGKQGAALTTGYGVAMQSLVAVALIGAVVTGVLSGGAPQTGSKR